MISKNKGDDPPVVTHTKRIARGRSVSAKLVGVLVLLLPSFGQSDTGKGLLSKLLGSHMNDVATKVAELPEKFGDVIPGGIDFSPDGIHIAIDSDHEKINIWHWRTEQIEKTVEKPGGNDGLTTNPIIYSPDGALLAACIGRGPANEFVRIWNTSTWTIAKDILDVNPGECGAVAFARDGKTILYLSDRVGHPGNHLIAYGVGDWQAQWGLKWDEFSPVSVAVSPDGTLAAIGGSIMVRPKNVTDITQRLQQTTTESIIYIVNLQQRKMVRTINNDAEGPMAWSPDGIRFAVSGGAVEILDSGSGQTLVHEELAKSGHMNVRFTPDRRYFVECDMNGRGTGLGVKIWDANRRKLLQEVPGNIGSIAVSRDSKYLAVGGTGRTTIWQFK